MNTNLSIALISILSCSILVSNDDNGTTPSTHIKHSHPITLKQSSHDISIKTQSLNNVTKKQLAIAAASSFTLGVICDICAIMPRIFFKTATSQNIIGDLAIGGGIFCDYYMLKILTQRWNLHYSWENLLFLSAASVAMFSIGKGSTTTQFLTNFI